MDKERVSIIAVGANIVLAISKISIGLASMSSAVIAEGIHSAADVLSSGLSFFGIRAAKKPADKEHPYGHYKFEVLSGLLITIVLFMTGLWILYKSYLGFKSPSLKEISYLAVGVMAFSAIVNEIMARIKVYYGKKEQSISLISDGIHSRVDVFSSLALFLGLLMTPIFIYTDPLLTLFIGVYIIKESFTLGKEATDSLLDVSAGEKIENRIREIVKGQNISLSELKTQKKGSAITANITIKLSKSLSVEEAIKISSSLQHKLNNNLLNLQYVAIQIDSHNVENSYFRPSEVISRMKIGNGFRWQRGGEYFGKKPEAKSQGSSGKCVCTKCKYEIGHQRGVPCSTNICPVCNIPLTREGYHFQKMGSK